MKEYIMNEKLFETAVLESVKECIGEPTEPYVETNHLKIPKNFLREFYYQIIEEVLYMFEDKDTEEQARAYNKLSSYFCGNEDLDSSSPLGKVYYANQPKTEFQSMMEIIDNQQKKIDKMTDFISELEDKIEYLQRSNSHLIPLKHNEYTPKFK